MTVLLIFIAAKIVILITSGLVLWKTLGHELRRPKPTYPMPGVRCVYCHASPAVFHSEETRWEDNDLVLVKTFECRRCHMPFWRVERVAAVEHRTT